MKYIFAIIILSSLGVALNYLLVNLVKQKNTPLHKSIAVVDDPLLMEMKREIDGEIGTVKASVQALMDEIALRFQELEKKEAAVQVLLEAADQRIQTLLQMREEESRLEGESETSINSHNFSKVYEMHQRGIDSATIAKSLGIGKGEVELRLGLLQSIK